MKSSRRSFLTKAAAATTLTTMPFATFGNELVQAVDQTSKRSAPSDLQITDIKCGYIRGGHSLFVKIYSNQDIVGHGEGVDATPGTYHLVKMFGERLKGKNPLNVHRLFEDIRRGGFFEGAQSGMYVAVLTAVETALWDLTGKALNLPVYQLLGGKFRDKIRVYMDTALYQNRLPKPEDFAASAKEAVDMGFTAVKFDLDQANDPNKYDKYNWTANARAPLGETTAKNRLAALKAASEKDETIIRVRWSDPRTIAGLCVFIPLLFFDEFLAISRGFICASKNIELADLCSAVGVG